MPALVSTLSICIVFVPMFLLSGVARYLFVPLAEAVVFAMLTSYILSRTLVPTLCKYWLRTRGARSRAAAANPNCLAALPARLRSALRGLRERYHGVLTTVLQHRSVFMTVFLGFAVRLDADLSRSWAGTSSPKSMPDRSSCTCAVRPACAWKTPRAWSITSRRRCARSFRRARSPASSTTSACRCPASI